MQDLKDMTLNEDIFDDELDFDGDTSYQDDDTYNDTVARETAEEIRKRALGRYIEELKEMMRFLDDGDRIGDIINNVNSAVREYYAKETAAGYIPVTADSAKHNLIDPLSCAQYSYDKNFAETLTDIVRGMLGIYGIEENTRIGHVVGVHAQFIENNISKNTANTDMFKLQQLLDSHDRNIIEGYFPLELSYKMSAEHSRFYLPRELFKNIAEHGSVYVYFILMHKLIMTAEYEAKDDSGFVANPTNTPNLNAVSLLYVYLLQNSLMNRLTAAEHAIVNEGGRTVEEIMRDFNAEITVRLNTRYDTGVFVPVYSLIDSMTVYSSDMFENILTKSLMIGRVPDYSDPEKYDKFAEKVAEIAVHDPDYVKTTNKQLTEYFKNVMKLFYYNDLISSNTFKKDTAAAVRFSAEIFNTNIPNIKKAAEDAVNSVLKDNAAVPAGNIDAGVLPSVTANVVVEKYSQENSAGAADSLSISRLKKIKQSKFLKSLLGFSTVERALDKSYTDVVDYYLITYQSVLRHIIHKIPSGSDTVDIDKVSSSYTQMLMLSYIFIDICYGFVSHIIGMFPEIFDGCKDAAAWIKGSAKHNEAEHAEISRRLVNNASFYDILKIKDAGWLKYEYDKVQALRTCCNEINVKCVEILNNQNSKYLKLAESAAAAEEGAGILYLSEEAKAQIDSLCSSTVVEKSENTLNEDIWDDEEDDENINLEDADAVERSHKEQLDYMRRQSLNGYINHVKGPIDARLHDRFVSMVPETIAHSTNKSLLLFYRLLDDSVRNKLESEIKDRELSDFLELCPFLDTDYWNTIYRTSPLLFVDDFIARDSNFLEADGILMSEHITGEATYSNLLRVALVALAESSYNLNIKYELSTMKQAYSMADITTLLCVIEFSRICVKYMVKLALLAAIEEEGYDPAEYGKFNINVDIEAYPLYRADPKIQFSIGKPSWNSDSSVYYRNLTGIYSARYSMFSNYSYGGKTKPVAGFVSDMCRLLEYFIRKIDSGKIKFHVTIFFNPVYANSNFVSSDYLLGMDNVIMAALADFSKTSMQALTRYIELVISLLSHFGTIEEHSLTFFVQGRNMQNFMKALLNARIDMSQIGVVIYQLITEAGVQKVVLLPPADTGVESLIYINDDMNPIALDDYRKGNISLKILGPKEQDLDDAYIVYYEETSDKNIAVPLISIIEDIAGTDETHSMAGGKTDINLVERLFNSGEIAEKIIKDYIK